MKKQRQELKTLKENYEKLIHNQQRLEKQLNGTNQEAKDFSATIAKLKQEAMIEANKIAEQSIYAAANAVGLLSFLFFSFLFFSFSFLCSIFLLPIIICF